MANFASLSDLRRFADLGPPGAVSRDPKLAPASESSVLKVPTSGRRSSSPSRANPPAPGPTDHLGRLRKKAVVDGGCEGGREEVEGAPEKKGSTGVSRKGLRSTFQSKGGTGMGDGGSQESPNPFRGATTGA